ncbi:MAG: signal peptidase I [Bacilli bacterium]|jgi:signal peptidase I
MKKEVNSKRIIRKVIALMVSAIFLSIMTMFGLSRFEIINRYFIILAIIFSFLISGYAILLKYIYHTRKQKYYYYQAADFIFILNCALIFIQFFFILVLFPATVYKTSMYPTLVEGDNLIVLSLGKIERERIVIVKIDKKYNVIEDGIEDQELVVKRVIAGPGDRFYFDDDGILYLNGNEINEDYLKDELGRFRKGFGLNAETEPFNMDSITYNAGIKLCEAEAECRIPDDYYFVMGDNRRHSIDSRHFGLVHKSQIMGVAKYKRNSLLDWEELE